LVGCLLVKYENVSANRNHSDTLTKYTSKLRARFATFGELLILMVLYLISLSRREETKMLLYPSSRNYMMTMTLQALGAKTTL